MINNLLKYKTEDFIPEELVDIKFSVNDVDYLNFLKDNNGGYFFENSLHIFGSTINNNFHDINYLNNLYNSCYGKLIDGILFFAEDIFGNPFGFYNNKVVHFNVETSEKEIIADNFLNWLTELFNDLDYFTGKSLALQLSKSDKIELAKGKRLAAKYPFILGGEYDINNLVLKNFEENIGYNASIAKQIVDVPDGTKIEIKFK